MLWSVICIPLCLSAIPNSPLSLYLDHLADLMVYSCANWEGKGGGVNLSLCPQFVYSLLGGESLMHMKQEGVL